MVMESLVVALLYIQLPSWRGWEEGLLKWVGGALGGEKGGGLVKLSTSGLDHSERNCMLLFSLACCHPPTLLLLMICPITSIAPGNHLFVGIPDLNKAG